MLVVCRLIKIGHSLTTNNKPPTTNTVERIRDLKRFATLSEALALEAREHIALVGGGGKTSLLFALARELGQTGRRVLTSTTTKVWHAEALKSPRLIFVRGNPDWRAQTQETLDKQGHLFLAETLLDSGKVEGIAPSLADELYRDGPASYLLLEADGSAGRPVKAPAPHEPVIPPSVTKVIALMGLEALGRPMGPEVAFRQDLVGKITGLQPGERMTVAAMSSLFLAPEGLFKGAPEQAGRLIFLNKLDMMAEEDLAWDLVHTVLGEALGKIERAVIGSLRKGVFFTGEKP